MKPMEESPENGGPPIYTVPVQIVQYVDDRFPGRVEAVLTGASGRMWSFVEKAPIFTGTNLDAQSIYPHPGVLACMLVDEGDGGICTIDTEKPWGVAALNGETRFEMPCQQVTKV